ncbi:MAG TPA: HAD family hydrolase [Candidatus Saccharimonadia bacterium]|nr:HAD family hydrolase [Candidatus Saccharimonadia bacterium]
MQYQAFIFDLDGTAIPNIPNGLPSDRLVKAIAKAKGRLRFCAATGRPITNAKPILDRLNLTDPCIISAGTQIVNPQTGQILWEAALDNKDVAAVLDICKPHHYEVLIRNELMGQGAPAARRIITESVNVIYIMQCSEADGQAILKELAEVPNITAAGVLSWTGEGLDIHVTHREATKEHAIAELLKMLDITKVQTIGVGDGNNDVHLFRGVGKKVAMGNATELLKSQADVVCDSVDHDGLAKFIEEFMS